MGMVKVTRAPFSRGSIDIELAPIISARSLINFRLRLDSFSRESVSSHCHYRPATIDALSPISTWIFTRVAWFWWTALERQFLHRPKNHHFHVRFQTAFIARDYHTYFNSSLLFECIGISAESGGKAPDRPASSGEVQR